MQFLIDFILTEKENIRQVIGEKYILGIIPNIPRMYSHISLTTKRHLACDGIGDRSLFGSHGV